ncbi:hypothetical protein IAT38_006008 [Cryptococcus sp. DSM 104549]
MDEATTQPTPPAEGLELVKDAYIRHGDVVFQWHSSLNPWQANAVLSLLSQNALYGPEHPLRQPGETGLTLYVGYDKTNWPRILFSLAQIQYLQYYIHTMRLTTPSWVEYHNRKAELQADVEEEEERQREKAEAKAAEAGKTGQGEGQAEAGGAQGEAHGDKAAEGREDGKEAAEGKSAKQQLAELVEPSYEEGKDDWVPLPNMFIRADMFIKIEKINVPSHFIMTKVNRQIEKEAKLADKHERSGLPPPVFSEARFEALVDNFTEGPGLRKGPLRDGGRRRERRDAGGEGGEGGEGRKSGGESETLTRAPQDSLAPTPLTSEAPTPSITSPLTSAGPATPAEPATPATPASLATPSSLSRDVSPMPPAPTPPPAPPAPAVDLGMRYFYFCQQALIVAAEGGFLNAYGPTPPKPFPSTTAPGAGADDEEEDEEGPTSQLPPEVGRSLFVSLTATRWEQDPNVVLEVGWSAVYWRPKIEGEAELDEEGVEREVEGAFVEARDWGHWVIQDHLLTKKNGKTKPDYRDAYLFGDTLPMESGKLKNALKSKLKELNKLAGNGPIYILTHTPAGEELHLKDIGLDIHTLDTEIQPDSWQVPPYQCVSGCKSVLLINTAALFGAIEEAPATGVSTILQQVGRTRKSLQHVGLMMFGQEPGRRPDKCGNAGNDAFYILQMFLALMLGPPLPELRVDYQQSLVQPPAPDAVDADTYAKMVETVPLLPSGQGSQREEQQSKDKDGEDDEGEDGGEYYEEEDERKFIDDPDYLEDENIVGVCYEDEDGNLIEM